MIKLSTQIQDLSANMTKIVCKYDQNCLQMSYLAGIPDSIIPDFHTRCTFLFSDFLKYPFSLPFLGIF